MKLFNYCYVCLFTQLLRVFTPFNNRVCTYVFVGQSVKMPGIKFVNVRTVLALVCRSWLGGIAAQTREDTVHGKCISIIICSFHMNPTFNCIRYSKILISRIFFFRRTNTKLRYKYTLLVFRIFFAQIAVHVYSIRCISLSITTIVFLT